MNTFDLNILSLYRIDGQELPLLPGLLAQNPPKKAARGREQDRLVVYLTLAGNSNYSSEEYTQIIGQVAEAFYNTPGSLTYALKTAAEWLNTFLVDKNMKSTGKGLYSIGELILCSLRGNSMYVVQAGPTHVYHLGAEVRHLHDAKLAGKGLGLSQTARLYFAQTTINPGDRVLLCAALPPNWDKSITEGRGSTALDMTRRRLLAITDTNVNALLMQTSAGSGSGALNILPITSATGAIAVSPPTLAAEPAASGQAEVIPTAQDVAAGTAAAPAEVLQATVSSAEQATTDPAVEPGNELELKEVIVAANPAEVIVNEPAPETSVDSEAGLAGEKQPAAPTPADGVDKVAQAQEYSPEPKIMGRVEPQVESNARRARFTKGIRTAAATLARLIAAGRAQTKSFKTWGAQALPRLMPGSTDDQQPSFFSRAWPVFFAFAIPVLLVVAARVVYDQLGDNAQYQIYYNHAAQAALQVSSETDPTNSRVQWKATLDWLDKADQFQEKPNPESQQLRKVAQSALDKLDYVLRLDFQPAFDISLGKNLQVTRMSASDTDIYLLDAVTGAVKRGTYNNTQKFSLDVEFVCGPGYYDGIQVGKLIDIIALPRSNPTEATLLGIDSSGNLLYCIPGKVPLASYLQMPDRSWNNITAMAYDANNLYVLDAPARAVWVYFGTGEIKFPEKPYFFFEAQIPVMLEQAIGMAVNGDDLYLLHKDGHLTTCTLSRLDVSPTRCNDPALYVDTRPGYTGGMHLSDGNFSQIAFTSAPDPSVALLEPFTQSVFRFSPRALELQNQVRSNAGKENTLPKGVPVTAMAFSPNKLLFIFLDNQVFFAKNVP